MPHPDPLVLKAAILLLPLIGLGIAFLVQRPGYFQLVGMMLGVLLNIPYLLLLNILAGKLGWWVYQDSPNSWHDVPIDLIVGWSIFWGAFLPYVFRTTSIVLPLVAAAFLDFVLMPTMPLLFVLGDGYNMGNWLVGETVLLTLCLFPGLVIFKLTVARERVLVRALIQSVVWGGWVVFLIPAIILQLEGKSIFYLLDMNLLRILTFLLFLTGSMVIGYMALFEFAVKGFGTPIPFDPPQKLVTTGIYSYVANPLQISTVLMFACMMWVFESRLMLVPIVILIVYSEVFVRWHHRIDIENRFGRDWFNYRRRVWNWIPRFLDLQT